jgi:hypothetical protein
MGLPQPFQFDPINPQSLDSRESQANMTELQALIASGLYYPGQRVIVLNGTNTPDVFRILVDGTYITDGADIDAIVKYFDELIGNLGMVLDRINREVV